MSERIAKQIRKQLRNVIQESMADILKSEVSAAIYTDLNKAISAKLDNLASEMRDVLNKVDQRSKDINNYVVNQTASVTPPLTTETKSNE